MAGSSSVKDVSNTSEFDKAFASPQQISVFHFWTEWAHECQAMNEVLDLLSKDEDLSSVGFYRAEAEELTEVSLKREITAVPTILITKNGEILSRIDGAKPAELTKTLKNLVASTTSKGFTPSKKTDLDTELKRLINLAPCVLFMKGDRENPKCGFSRQSIDLLKSMNAEYATFDILTNDDVRQGLKTYSNWPTYPQLYLNGELLGGLDIMKDMKESGELELPTKVDLNSRIEQLLKSDLIVFMKGSREAPKCGFSRQLMEILKESSITTFETFDILEDEDIRQGLKKYSNWPTYPQVYVKGELIGGLDIIKELKDANELISSLTV